MPKTRNTIAQRKVELINKLSIPHILSETSIFKKPIGKPPLDAYTVDHIKEGLALWWNSWVKDELDFLMDKI
jgi:hypothetical protein